MMFLKRSSNKKMLPLLNRSLLRMLRCRLQSYQWSLNSSLQCNSCNLTELTLTHSNLLRNLCNLRNQYL